jgi:hypothetical protein
LIDKTDVIGSSMVETILFVDDDIRTLNALQQTLSRQGSEDKDRRSDAQGSNRI